MNQIARSGLGWLLIVLCLPALAFAGWYAWSAAFAPIEQLDGYKSAMVRLAKEAGPVEAVRRKGELETNAGQFRFNHGVRAVIFTIGAGVLISTAIELLRRKSDTPAGSSTPLDNGA